MLNVELCDHVWCTSMNTCDCSSTNAGYGSILPGQPSFAFQAGELANHPPAWKGPLHVIHCSVCCFRRKQCFHAATRYLAAITPRQVMSSSRERALAIPSFWWFFGRCTAFLGHVCKACIQIWRSLISVASRRHLEVVLECAGGRDCLHKEGCRQIDRHLHDVRVVDSKAIKRQLGSRRRACRGRNCCCCVSPACIKCAFYATSGLQFRVAKQSLR